MRLEVGKEYRTRGGKTVRIVKMIEGPWPAVADNGHWYTIDGWMIDEWTNSPADIVAEVFCVTTLAAHNDAPLPEPYDGPLSDGDHTNSVLDEVFVERERQETKWGVQNHAPAGWLPILMEEVGEVARAMCEWTQAYTPDAEAVHVENYREELVQVAAVAVAMIEALDRAEKA